MTDKDVLKTGFKKALIKMCSPHAAVDSSAKGFTPFH